MTQPQINLAISVPPEVEAAQFANFVGVWHDSDGFVLDFAALTSPGQVGTDDDGNQVTTVPAKVISRVRIPPSQAFELMRALNTQLDAYEAAYGKKSTD